MGIMSELFGRLFFQTPSSPEVKLLLELLTNNAPTAPVIIPQVH